MVKFMVGRQALSPCSLGMNNGENLTGILSHMRSEWS